MTSTGQMRCSTRIRPFQPSWTRIWDDEIVPTLTDYIRIPNKSPAFDPDWEKHGHMDKAVALFEPGREAKLESLARRDAGSGAAARPHAADLHRNSRRPRPARFCCTAISTSSRR